MVQSSNIQQGNPIPPVRNLLDDDESDDDGYDESDGDGEDD